MKRKYLIPLILVVLLLTACAKGTANPDSSNLQSQASDKNEANSETSTDENASLDNSGNEASEDNSKEKQLSSKEMYMDFLEGNCPVYVDKIEIPERQTYKDGTTIPSFKKNTPYNLEEFISVNFNLQREDYSVMYVSEIEYALIDCGNDGEPELALRLVYATESLDNLEFQYIIKNIDNKLQLCCDIQTFYRASEFIANDYGLIVRYGSNSAYSYSSSYSYINADGDYIFLYSAETEYGLGADYGDLGGIYSVTSKYADVIDPDWCMVSYTFDDPKDIDYDNFDYSEYLKGLKYTADPDDNKTIQKLFKEADIKLYTQEQIHEIVNKNNLSRGISEKIFDDQEGIDFEPVETTLAKEITEYGINTVHVKTVDEFISAIADDTTIVLAPGTYNITEYLLDNDNNLTEYFYEADNPAGVLTTGGLDIEIFVNEIHNLTIVSEKVDDPAQIVCEPRYAQVMTFNDCSNIILNNLIMGHTPEQGVCSGDVVAFDGCSFSYVKNCDLYGCGAYGLNISNCGNIKVTDTVIHDCSYGCAEIYDTSYIYFDGCSFLNCREFTMFEIHRSYANFYNCTFKDLEGDMIYLTEDASAYFNNCLYDCSSLTRLQSYSGNGYLHIN